jgi:hypothetical protein
MSEDAYCDVCGKMGWRRRRHVSPDDWFFSEVKNADSPADSLIALACSVTCRDRFWTPGPGQYDPVTGDIICSTTSS